jgi:hypothetical protein
MISGHGCRDRDRAMSKMDKPIVDEDVAAMRRRLVLDEARTAGLVGQGRDTRIRARVGRRLIEAAKAATGIKSDRRLVEYALARVALEDDFGMRLLRRWGTVPAEVELDF